MVSLPIRLHRSTPAPSEGRSGIIDIGSNSIRLVIYDGPARIPAILFNEKVMAGLGRGVSRDGALDHQAIDRALLSLARFQRVAEQMGVPSPRTVATAAVRDASNGAAFLDRVAAIGLDVELLSGEDEARMAGLGVLAGIPEADGIVGDLGGGSLELVRVRGGEIHQTSSIPFGVLRIGDEAQEPASSLGNMAAALAKVGWTGYGRGLPFYMVGGSWRSLARLDMHLNGLSAADHPPLWMDIDNAQRLVRVLAQLDKKRIRPWSVISGSRIPTLKRCGAALLTVLSAAVSVERTGRYRLMACARGCSIAACRRTCVRSIR
jgi:exopolyphosphatase/guanosine-5'-triphosphate,3'-diphosphate pyrophosphatase